MPEQHFDLSDPAVGAVIRRKAAKLAKIARAKASTPANRDDLAQDLWVTVARNWKQFDSARGDLRVFLHVLVENAAANLLRRLLARKRSGPGPSQHLEDCPDSRQAEHVLLHELRLDVSEALEAMPAWLREVADKIAKSDTIADAARELGVSRGTLYSRLAAIRKRFENRELQKYLENGFDTSSSNRVVP
ncbi:MAG TPA: sigma factor [Urbifossiella sp.]